MKTVYSLPASFSSPSWISIGASRAFKLRCIIQATGNGLSADALPVSHLCYDQELVILQLPKIHTVVVFDAIIVLYEFDL